MPNDILSVFHENRRQLLLIVGGTFFFGLLFEAILNQAVLGLVVSQFGVLWNENRPMVIGLLFRIVLIAAIFSQVALACYLAVSVVWQDDEMPAQDCPPDIESVALDSEAKAYDTTYEVIQVSDIIEMEESANAVHPEQVLPEEQPRNLDTVEPDSIFIEISLLKNVKMHLYVPRLGKRYPIKIELNTPRARHLIAYIAAHQGRAVRLDDVRTYVFDSDAFDADQIQTVFSTAKRDIRRRIAQAVEQAKSEGAQIQDDLDFLVLEKSRKYALSDYCRVVDLSLIEQQSRIIEQAEHQLINSVPEHVKEACDECIAAYTGDFIEELLIEDPIDPWVQSWAREPFTRYRDAYLQALFYAGEYERRAGDYTNAARLFVQGAMAACNSRICDGRFDTKVSFKGGRYGPHVTLSEQMIRHAITCYGKLGATTLIHRAYGTYEQQMLRVSGRAWTPHPETTKVLEDALKQTSDM